MKGYWRRPDETAKTMRGDWFLTGDIGVMDPDGYIRIVDRKKDMVVVSGFNVYPNEIEDCLATHPGVLESAVIGVPDAATGEAVKAFIVARDAGPDAGRHPRPLQGTPDRLQGAQDVEFRDDLPKSNVGKILRKDLRAELSRKRRRSSQDGRSLRTGASRRHDLRHHAGHGRVADPARLLAGAQTPLRPDDRGGVAIRVHALHRLRHGDHADLPDPIAVGLLIVSCMPGGTTSNIFTYFSKGNLALSVLMTVTSTVFGVLLIPIVLLIYASALDLTIPRENIIATLVVLLIPVAIGMGLRKINANVGAVTEFMGSALALFFIALHRDLLGAAKLAVPARHHARHLFRRDHAGRLRHRHRLHLRAHPQAAPAQCAHRGAGNRHPERPAGHRHHRAHLRGRGTAKHHRRGRALLAFHRDHLDRSSP
jgi:hypothetical protein